MAARTRTGRDAVDAHFAGAARAGRAADADQVAIAGDHCDGHVAGRSTVIIVARQWRTQARRTDAAFINGQRGIEVGRVTQTDGQGSVAGRGVAVPDVVIDVGARSRGAIGRCAARIEDIGAVIHDARIGAIVVDRLAEKGRAIAGVPSAPVVIAIRRIEVLAGAVGHAACAQAGRAAGRIDHGAIDAGREALIEILAVGNVSVIAAHHVGIVAASAGDDRTTARARTIEGEDIKGAGALQRIGDISAHPCR